MIYININNSSSFDISGKKDEDIVDLYFNQSIYTPAPPQQPKDHNDGNLPVVVENNSGDKPKEENQSSPNPHPPDKEKPQNSVGRQSPLRNKTQTTTTAATRTGAEGEGKIIETDNKEDATLSSPVAPSLPAGQSQLPDSHNDKNVDNNNDSNTPNNGK